MPNIVILKEGLQEVLANLEADAKLVAEKQFFYLELKELIAQRLTKFDITLDDLFASSELQTEIDQYRHLQKIRELFFETSTDSFGNDSESKTDTPQTSYQTLAQSVVSSLKDAHIQNTNKKELKPTDLELTVANEIVSHLDEDSKQAILKIRCHNIKLSTEVQMRVLYQIIKTRLRKKNLTFEDVLKSKYLHELFKQHNRLIDLLNIHEPQNRIADKDAIIVAGTSQMQLDKFILENGAFTLIQKIFDEKETIWQNAEKSAKSSDPRKIFIIFALTVLNIFHSQKLDIMIVDKSKIGQYCFGGGRLNLVYRFNKFLIDDPKENRENNPDSSTSYKANKIITDFFAPANQKKQTIAEVANELWPLLEEHDLLKDQRLTALAR